VFDIVLGYPSATPAASDRFPCSTPVEVFDQTCFGVYLYDGQSTDDPYQRFLWSTANGKSSARK
jgi:hypothetical protein